LCRFGGRHARRPHIVRGFAAVHRAPRAITTQRRTSGIHAGFAAVRHPFGPGTPRV
jgi:hypothetical protein